MIMDKKGVAFVTGAASGIGEAIARACENQNALPLESAPDGDDGYSGSPYAGRYCGFGYVCTETAPACPDTCHDDAPKRSCHIMA